MPKIVIVSPFYYPSKGGVESIVKITAEELAKRKNRVVIITTNYSNSWTKLTEECITVENDVTIYRLQPLIKIGYAAFFKKLKNILEKERPDIVHTHNLHPHLFQSIIHKNNLKYKIVAQLHYPLATGIDHISAKIAFPAVIKLLVHNQRKVDAFIVHSTIENNWLLRSGVDQSRIYKLCYPCFSFTSKEYMSAKLIITKKNDFSNFLNNPDILYIGRITSRKGIHILLNALSIVSRDIKTSTIIAGPSDKKYLDFLLDLAKNLNLKNVSFLSSVSEEQKFKLLAQCKIFVVPSILDYTPVTLIEAQAMGKPIISTYTGAVSELVQAGKTGLLIEPQNAQALAKAISILLLSTEKRLTMGQRAEDWVRENFSTSDVVNKLEKLYSDCLAA